MALLVIGDLHGKVPSYQAILRRLHLEDPEAVTVQVGDIGLGFERFLTPKCGPNDWFITGNHDDDTKARGVEGYLGRFGVRDLAGYKVFYCSGAMSTDRQYRVEGESWWPNEELSYAELSEAVALYEAVKPDVMISHDCPSEIRAARFGYREGGRTVQALTQMYALHKPRFWAFGHHHVQMHHVLDETCFICVGELHTKKIDEKLFLTYEER